MEEYLIRFLAGGLTVSLFAEAGDLFRPKSFAGLFAAAPSIAIATLLIAQVKQGPDYAAIEGRSMMLGALALMVYSIVSCQLMARFLFPGLKATALAAIAWFACAFGLYAILVSGP